MRIDPYRQSVGMGHTQFNHPLFPEGEGESLQPLSSYQEIQRHMKALTVWQPWASLIADGRKRYETRSWPTRHRGPLAIHAGKNSGAIGKAGIGRFPLGAIVAVAEIVQCHRTEDIRDSLSEEELGVGDYSPGRFAWELVNVNPIEPPIPARGYQGLWEWTGDIP